MKLRMITYGYRMENGKIVVSETEVEIIRRIFREYSAGSGLKNIADGLTQDGIVVLEGNTKWSKNRIDRILSEEKYIGSKEYPKILTDDEFAAVQKIKEGKGFKVQTCPPIFEYLKKKVRCGQCGKLFSRQQHGAANAKWSCSAGCACDRFISDKVLFSGITETYLRIKRQPELLTAAPEYETFERTPEIIRQTNEIGRMLDMPDPSFEVGKKIIYECAALKFRACKEDRRAVYTDKVLREIDKGNEKMLVLPDYFQKIISEIIVGKSGKIAVKFMNDTIVESMTEVKHGRSGKKNSNENCSQSVTVKEEY